MPSLARGTLYARNGLASLEALKPAALAVKFIVRIVLPRFKL